MEGKNYGGEEAQGLRLVQPPGFMATDGAHDEWCTRRMVRTIDGAHDKEGETGSFLSLRGGENVEHKTLPLNP